MLPKTSLRHRHASSLCTTRNSEERNALKYSSKSFFSEKQTTHAECVSLGIAYLRCRGSSTKLNKSTATTLRGCSPAPEGLGFLRLRLSFKYNDTAVPFPQHARLFVVVTSSLLVLVQFLFNDWIKLFMLLDHALMTYGERAPYNS